MASQQDQDNMVNLSYQPHQYRLHRKLTRQI